MPYTYTFEIVDGHIIADIEGKRALIDTGSPVCVGDGDFVMAGETFSASPSFHRATLQNIAAFLDVEIRLLIGTNALLKGHVVDIGWPEQEIHIDVEPSAVEGESVNYEIVMGVPVIELRIEGKIVRAFFDTGAKISYLRSGIRVGQESADEYPDFHLEIGGFYTKLADTKISLGGKDIVMRFGALPSALEMGIMGVGVDAIIGTDVFKHFSGATLDHFHGIIAFRP